MWINLEQDFEDVTKDWPCTLKIDHSKQVWWSGDRTSESIIDFEGTKVNLPTSELRKMMERRWRTYKDFRAAATRVSEGIENTRLRAIAQREREKQEIEDIASSLYDLFKERKPLESDASLDVSKNIIYTSHKGRRLEYCKLEVGEKSMSLNSERMEAFLDAIPTGLDKHQYEAAVGLFLLGRKTEKELRFEEEEARRRAIEYDLQNPGYRHS